MGGAQTVFVVVFQDEVAHTLTENRVLQNSKHPFLTVRPLSTHTHTSAPLSSLHTQTHLSPALSSLHTAEEERRIEKPTSEEVNVEYSRVLIKYSSMKHTFVSKNSSFCWLLPCSKVAL